VQTIRAALFDVDGTLYHQIPLRLLMGWELCRLPLERRSLRAARQTWRTIAAFRRVREDLRRRGAAGASLERLQYQLTGERSGTPLDLVESTVVEWIHSRPLRHLRRCRRAGLESLQ
jgi:FMN phosphatase YigB (HAD superfamily)